MKDVITIREVENGFILDTGIYIGGEKTFVFETFKDMVKWLEDNFVGKEK